MTFNNLYYSKNEYDVDVNDMNIDSSNILDEDENEKIFKNYINSAYNGDVNCQKAAARCYMFGIGTEKNYRKACQFLKIAAHQKDIEAMIILAEGYNNGTFLLQEEFSDEEDYPDEDEVSSESEDSIRFSSSSSFSSDDSYLSDDIMTQDENDSKSSSNSNQIVPTIEKSYSLLNKSELQVLPSPNKTNNVYVPIYSNNNINNTNNNNNKNILITPTKTPNKLNPKTKVKRIYRKKVSLLNTFNNLKSPNIQKIQKTIIKNNLKEKRKNKYLNKKKKFSFHYRKMAAKYGDLSSIKYVAKAYDFGLDDIKLSHNGRLAEKYYKIAAKEYEDVDSLRRLGDIYYYHDDNTNKSNNKNKIISFNYYQKAALLGDLKASAKVAHCLYFGEGVPQNIQQAYKLLLKVAENNNDGQLMKYIGDEYFYGTDTTVTLSNKNKDSTIKPDLSVAFEYYYKAIKMKDASACKTVGNHHFLGIPKYLKSDPKKAIEYYEQAIDLGDYSVIKLIADCYLFGIGVKRNIDKAKKLYETLKENGLWEGEMPSPDAEIDLDI
ncbi:HCP-like protein [Anaeromyces robustus]|uniref:HCP-like protein n=1 Tax=Anaeromyces robustus TaxID=1754192 RepID=A0A1Y1X273_9FUNG|nr:HCP-like protein [Anaeromyces robustus]|eukprot:ORX79883.1 HCP-like protein [Anaeromyces robustus]